MKHLASAQKRAAYMRGRRPHSTSLCNSSRRLMATTQRSEKRGAGDVFGGTQHVIMRLPVAHWQRVAIPDTSPLLRQHRSGCGDGACSKLLVLISQTGDDSTSLHRHAALVRLTASANQDRKSSYPQGVRRSVAVAPCRPSRMCLEGRVNAAGSVPEFGRETKR